MIDAAHRDRASVQLSSEEGDFRDDWERKQSGTDFRREIFQDLEQSGIRVSKTDTHLIDDAFVDGSHGVTVQNEVLENTSQAQIGEQIKWSDIKKPGFIHKIRGKNLKGSVVNISYATGADEVAYRNLSALADAGADIIISAGNRGDEAIAANTIKLAREGKAIVVGAHTMEGLNSHYSQYKGIVHLTAGVGREIQIDRSDGHGNQSDWGTSYAAPQLAGVWADLRAILPEASRSELLEIVQKTSTQTLGVQNGNSQHGAGALNAYKALSVAKKIRMGDPEPYNFYKESKEAFERAELLEAQGKSSDAMDQYRKAFLLNQTGREAELARQKLVDLMNKEGLDRESKYYASLSPDEAERQNFLAAQAASGDKFVRLAAQASLRDSREEVQSQYIASAARSNSPEALGSAVELWANPSSKVEGLNVSDTLLPRVSELAPRQKALVYSLAFQEEESRSPLKSYFEQLYRDGNKVQKQIARSGLAALGENIREPNNYFQNRIAQATRELRDPQLFDMLDSDRAEAILWEEHSRDPGFEIWGSSFERILEKRDRPEDRVRQFKAIQASSRPDWRELFISAESDHQQELRHLFSEPWTPDLSEFLRAFFKTQPLPERSRLLEEFRGRSVSEAN